MSWQVPGEVEASEILYGLGFLGPFHHLLAFLEWVDALSDLAVEDGYLGLEGFEKGSLGKGSKPHLTVPEGLWELRAWRVLPYAGSPAIAG